LLDENFTFKPKEEIRQILTANGLDLNRPVITTCTKGIVSSICYLLLIYISKTDITMHAGNWLEYIAALQSLTLARNSPSYLVLHTVALSAALLSLLGEKKESTRSTPFF